MEQAKLHDQLEATATYLRQEPASYDLKQHITLVTHL
jgi:hypothetical protein